MAQVLCFVRVVLCLLLMVYGVLHVASAVDHAGPRREGSVRVMDGPDYRLLAVAVGCLLILASLVLFPVPGARP